MRWTRLIGAKRRGCASSGLERLTLSGSKTSSVFLYVRSGQIKLKNARPYPRVEKLRAGKMMRGEGRFLMSATQRSILILCQQWPTASMPARGGKKKKKRGDPWQRSLPNSRHHRAHRRHRAS